MGLVAAGAISSAEEAGYSVRRFDVGDGMAVTAGYCLDRLTVVINRDELDAEACTGCCSGSLGMTIRTSANAALRAGWTSG